MNKNLMAIFHTEFRQNDIVEFEHLGKKDWWKVLYRPVNSTLTRVINTRKEYVLILKLGKNVKRITKFVSLVEVLKMMKKKKCMLSIDENGDFREIPDGNRIHNGEYLPHWILSDKSGEVPLHRQSKETISAIWEVLK